MGNPLGLEFANSVTSGIISASERTIDTQTSAGTNKVNVLQTDAPLILETLVVHLLISMVI